MKSEQLIVEFLPPIGGVERELIFDSVGYGNLSPSILLDRLATTYPDLKTLLFDISGNYTGVYRVAINGNMIKNEQLSNIRLKGGDHVQFIISLQGG